MWCLFVCIKRILNSIFLTLSQSFGPHNTINMETISFADMISWSLYVLKRRVPHEVQVDFTTVYLSDGSRQKSEMSYLRGHKWQIHGDLLIRTITKASGRSGKLAFCVVSVHGGNLFTSNWHRRVQLQPPGTWILNIWRASAIILETDQQRDENETEQRRRNKRRERERERILIRIHVFVTPTERLEKIFRQSFCRCATCRAWARNI